MNTAFNLARQCPRFDRCSVNRCPLGEGYPNQFAHPDDREKRCTMEKGVRVRIAASEPGRLAMSGLTVPEHAAKRSYEAKPTAVKLKWLEATKHSRFARRGTE